MELFTQINGGIFHTDFLQVHLAEQIQEQHH